MTTRTFKQFGQAYGNVPATIVVNINGSEIFSGAVPTENTVFPSFPNPEITVAELFTWTNTVDFAGTQSFSISVQNSPLLLAYTQTDYVMSNNVSAFSVVNTYDDGGVTVSDPFTNVAIDGVAMQRGPDNNPLSGQWFHIIPAGSTFTATLNIKAGVEPSPPPT